MVMDKDGVWILILHNCRNFDISSQSCLESVLRPKDNHPVSLAKEYGAEGNES